MVFGWRKTDGNGGVVGSSGYRRILRERPVRTGERYPVAEVRLGFARTEMTVEPRHLNSVGILQGGALFTLADLAFAVASNSHGVVAVACQADVTWFKAVRSGKLAAVAEESPARASSRHV